MLLVSSIVYETTVKELTPALIPLVPANGFKLVTPSMCLKTERFIEGEAAFVKTATATRSAGAGATASASAVRPTGSSPVSTTTKVKDDTSAGQNLVVGGLAAAAAIAAAAALL